MRGSVYYQSAVLTKVIFFEGLKKENRTNPNHAQYQCISSFKTMESYRSVWNNFFNYLKEHFKVKNFELITSEHIKSYIEYKIEYYPSKQYLEKITSALGKLEIALNKYSKEKYDNPITYDFRIRQELLTNAKDLKLVANNYHNRVYINSILIIENLKNENHQIAAAIQLEGGARSEGVTLIKEEQLKGFKIDNISKKTVGVIETKEKGGKVGDVLVWNYGLLSKVISKEISPSGKSVYLITQPFTRTIHGNVEYDMLRRNRYNINTLLVTNPLMPL